MKKKLLFIFVLIMFIVPIKNVFAENSLNDVIINVTLKDDGNAHVKQIWQTYSDENSEFYIPFEKSHNGTVTNLTVRDETGKVYDNIDDWKENRSLEEKANKAALRSYQREIVFGITNYGNKTYEIDYDLENLVQRFEDSDGLYFQFFNNFKVPPKKLKITVEKQGLNFTNDNSKVYIKDIANNVNYINNKIEIVATKSLTEKNKVKLLMSLDKNLVNPKTTTDITFEHFKKSTLDSDSNYKAEIIGVGIFLIVIILIAILYIGRISLKTRIPRNINRVRLTKKDITKTDSELKELLNSISPEEIFYLTNILNKKNKKLLEPSKVENILTTYFIEYTYKNIFQIVSEKSKVKNNLGIMESVEENKIYVNKDKIEITSGIKAELLEIITNYCLDEDGYFDKEMLEKYLKENVKEIRWITSQIREQGLVKCIERGLITKSKFSLKLTKKGIEEIFMLYSLAESIKNQRLDEYYLENDMDNLEFAISLGLAKQFIELRKKYNLEFELEKIIKDNFQIIKIENYVDNIFYLQSFGIGFAETFPMIAGFGSVGGGIGGGGGAR